MCRVYDVKPSGYYSWKERGRSLRSYEDEALYEVIFDIFTNSKELYGSPKITKAMRAMGYRIGKKRVARIMQENGLKAKVSTLYKAQPGLKQFIAAIPYSELSERADHLNKVWVGDVTYLRLNGEWRYLAVVMDKCSRKILGWSLSDKRDAKLTWKAMSYALSGRAAPKGLIFHTDRGIEYRAHEFTRKVSKRGIQQSMNRPRRMNDNAFMESFFSNFKSEKIHKEPEFETEGKMRGAIRDYICFYNKERSHSSIGYLTPVEYEGRMS